MKRLLVATALLLTPTPLFAQVAAPDAGGQAVVLKAERDMLEQNLTAVFNQLQDVSRALNECRAAAAPKKEETPASSTTSPARTEPEKTE